MKVCSKCHNEKDETEFYIRGSSVHSECKKCLIKRSNVRAGKNKETIRQYHKAYWKEYYKRNKENILLYGKEYRKLNIDKERARVKRWRAKNPIKRKLNSNKYMRAARLYLNDYYIKLLLHQQGLPEVINSPELIKLQRNIIKIKREIWKSKTPKKQSQTA